MSETQGDPEGPEIASEPPEMVAALERTKASLDVGVIIWPDAPSIPWTRHWCVVAEVYGSPPTFVRLVPGTSKEHDGWGKPVAIAAGEVGEPRQNKTTYFYDVRCFWIAVGELRTGADGGPATFRTSLGHFSEERMSELLGL